MSKCFSRTRSGSLITTRLASRAQHYGSRTAHFHLDILCIIAFLTFLLSLALWILIRSFGRYRVLLFPVTTVVRFVLVCLSCFFFFYLRADLVRSAVRLTLPLPIRFVPHGEGGE